MFRFKKEYANQHIVLANGLLINAANCESEEAQAAFKASPSFAYMLEEVVEPSASTVEEESAKEEAKPKKTRTRKA